MLFNSLEFMLFFPVVVALHYLLPPALRWIWLLGASVFFYLSFIPWFIIPLLLIIIVEFVIGILISYHKRGNRRRSRMVLMIGILFPVMTLIFFKYSALLDGAVLEAARFLHLQYPRHILRALLPVGISYYALQGISYAVDIYRGDQKPERHFGIFALYILFFPKIISGPIERPGDLLRQFHEKHPPDYPGISGGLQLIIMGFFKKLVIADRIGIAVNDVFDNLGLYHGAYFLLATVLFSIQIYCDFSGYTDIARGSARVLGFRLTENFRSPYRALTLPEFWKRWHISLTSWLRDYVYIPLGGSREGAVKRYRNILVTFIISGLWHGQNMTFIVWGGIHGLMMLIGIWTAGLRSALASLTRFDRVPVLRTALQMSVTASLVTFAWIFFRAANISDALFIARNILLGCGDIVASLVRMDTNHLKALADIARGNTILGFSRDTYRPEMLIMMGSIFGLILSPAIKKRACGRESSAEKLESSPWLLYCIMALGIIFLGMFSKEQFIYFRF